MSYSLKDYIKVVKAVVARQGLVLEFFIVSPLRIRLEVSRISVMNERYICSMWVMTTKNNPTHEVFRPSELAKTAAYLKLTRQAFMAMLSETNNLSTQEA